MNLTEIYVENNQVDISADLSALLTFTIDDVKDFSARNTTFSKTIVLPGTSRNNAVFGNIFAVNNGNFYDSTKTNIGYNFNVAKAAKCFIFQGNIQVFKGVIRIMEIIIDNGKIEYECAVFGELGGLIAKLGNNQLEKLDFSAYDHVYNYTNITNSWNAAKGSGYYYPLIDYGNASTNKHDWDIRTFRPALYVKEYIDKIFAASGYTYQCDLFNTARFKSLIIPHNRKILDRLTSDVFFASRTTNLLLLSQAIGRFDFMPFQTNSGALFTADAAKQTFTYNGTTPLNINVIIGLSGNYDADQNTITGSLRKNGTTVPGAIKTFGDTGGMNIGWYWNQTIQVSLVQNDYIQLYFKATGSVSTNFSFTVGASEFDFKTNYPTLVPVNPGDTVNTNSTIPKNILQKDFLASIIKLFNLYVYEDKDQPGVIFIKPYPDFFNTNLAASKDWTYKLNRNKPIRIKPMSELNSRYYEFKYKGDSDYFNDQYQKRYNQNYGDYIYDSSYEFAHERTAVELIFSGTPIVGYNGESKIYPTIFKRTGTTTLVEENIDSVIRIMQSKTVSSTPSWQIKDGATVLGTLTSYGYAGHLDDPDAPNNDLNFGVPKELYFTLIAGSLQVNQFNIYWSPYMSEITDKDSRLFSGSFRLNFTDIHNIDFSTFISIDGNLYALNKVEDYNATNEDECKVTLLKVIDSNAIASVPLTNNDEVYTYIGLGTEGSTIYIGKLTGMVINAVWKGDKLLVPVASNPDVNSYSFNAVTAVFTFGTTIQQNQIIQILYKKQ